MKIIPFKTEYEQQVIDLILGIQIGEFNVPITINDQPDLKMIPTFYQQSKGQFWVAIFENKVVGTIALIDSGEKFGTIRKMFVAQQYRGKEYNVAQQLFDILENHALENMLDTLILGTIERLKAAIRFYERNGFEQIIKISLPEKFPLMSVDTHFFQKKIS
jgi:putative acetyltransferase